MLTLLIGFIIVYIFILLSDARWTFWPNICAARLPFGINFENGHSFVDTDTCLLEFRNIDVSLLQVCDDLE